MKDFKIGDKITCTELQHPAVILGVYDTDEYTEYWIRPDKRERAPGRVTRVTDDYGGNVALYNPETPIMWYTTNNPSDVQATVDELNTILARSDRRLVIEKNTWGSDSGDSGITTDLSMVLQVNDRYTRQGQGS